VIQLQKLSKSYGPKEVLDNINITFEAGKIHGIVGANGAGKTTLFRCIAGLENHLGTIRADQQPLKNHLGFLVTNPFVFQKITGREYLFLHVNARGKTIKDLDQKNIFDLPLDEYAAHYSTGMKKKLALLAILLTPNDYYILDEPFNGVDIQSNIIITAIIKELRALGKTILISSHIFATLSDLCDTIYHLKGGNFSRIVSDESFSSLEEEMREVSIGNRIEQLHLDQL
jgi:ABC-2 type transport system ATP-binding protein